MTENLARRTTREVVEGQRSSRWTGRPPIFGQCPGVTADGSVYSLPLPRLDLSSRQHLLDYFDNGWLITDVLFSSLNDDSVFYETPAHHLRHPLIFYYGHPAALYVNKLRVAGLLDAPVNAEFERLFETGVDEMSWDDYSRDEKAWPSVEAVQEYRRTVYLHVRELLAHHPAFAPESLARLDQSPAWAMVMAFEHERIHIETSSVLIRELPLSFIRRPRHWPRLAARGSHEPGANPLLPVEAGVAQLGKPSGFPSYGWDNEYGAQERFVPAFEASAQLISNGEMLEFVRSGGYLTERYWSADGWRWRSYKNTKWPAFWVPDGPAGLHQYHLRTCFELIELPLAWPAIVNWYEAQAYCAWRTERDGSNVPYRLLTEAEHHRLRDLGGDIRANPGLDAIFRADSPGMAERGRNLNLAFGSEGPVNGGTPTARGHHDVFGNVWQWLEDHFHPLPGAAPHPFYDDFSVPCYDGRHQMIMGGSFVSTGDMASHWARFHFRPHFFQHAGFRLVRGATIASGAVRLEERAGSYYTSDQGLSEYLLLHYGTPAEQMPWPQGPAEACGFPSRVAGVALEYVRRLGLSGGRALDLGCAVGRSTFELARELAEIVGVDASPRFIEIARHLQRSGQLPYAMKEEGEIERLTTAVVPPELDRSRVSFQVGDACALSPTLGTFDVVLLSNVLCRLPSPRACLEQLPGAVRPGGLLVLTTPFSWATSYTPAEAWLGGRRTKGVEERSRDVLVRHLERDFELLQENEIAVLIREHARKFQYIMPLLTVWRRRA